MSGIERRDCECGCFIETNDNYMIDEWNGWHEAGAFLAGMWHRPVPQSSPPAGLPAQKGDGSENLSSSRGDHAQD